MRTLLYAAALAATLPVYATPSAAVTLSADDPKFDTPQCRQARAQSERWAAEHGGGRFMYQFAWWGIGGFLVPPGTYEPTKEQAAIERKLQRACVSKPRRR